MFSSFLLPKGLSQVAGTSPFLCRSYFYRVVPKIRGIICKRIIRMAGANVRVRIRSGIVQIQAGRAA
jgi:hypothetical protein